MRFGNETQSSLQLETSNRLSDALSRSARTYHMPETQRSRESKTSIGFRAALAAVPRSRLFLAGGVDFGFRF